MTAYDLEREKNDQHTIGIQVKTGEGTTLTNLRLVYDEADQPGGVFPQGVHVDIGTPQFPSWEGPGVGSLPFTIWADNTADETTPLVLRVVSDECDDETCPVSGQQEWETIVIDAAFSDPALPTPPQPYLFVTPGYVGTGVAYDETATEIVTLKNRGAADLHDVSLTLLSTPDWVTLNSPAVIAVIPVGELREVRLLFSPTAAVPEGQQSVGTLRIESPDVPAVEIGLYATVTQSGEGQVLLKVSDIYTGTLDEQEQPIPRLAGARITIQNEVVTSITQTSYTDSTGEALFEALPSGRYTYRITADNHQETAGRLWIKPGITTSQEEFLEYNLVTVEWEVREITIEDRYEIVLKATYKTDVPAPVVVVEPASVSLPEMQAGDVFQGEFTLTNHGLVRADNLQFMLPADDEYFDYELLGGLPENLKAKETIIVPYRVTCLQPFGQTGEGDGSGGGCSTYTRCGWKTYDYLCANGKPGESQESAPCFTAISCSGGGGGALGMRFASPPGIGDRDIDPNLSDFEGPGSGGGGSGSSGGSPAPMPDPMTGLPECYPDPNEKECDHCNPPETQEDQGTETNGG